MPPDRDLPPLFGRGVRILYTPAKVDIHPRTPLEGKIQMFRIQFLCKNPFEVLEKMQYNT